MYILNEYRVLSAANKRLVLKQISRRSYDFSGDAGLMFTALAGTHHQFIKGQVIHVLDEYVASYFKSYKEVEIYF